MAQKHSAILEPMTFAFVIVGVALVLSILLPGMITQAGGGSVATPPVAAFTGAPPSSTLEATAGLPPGPSETPVPSPTVEYFNEEGGG